MRAFIPVVNSNGRPGLFDIVEQKFYDNSGTGMLEAGPESEFILSTNTKV